MNWRHKLLMAGVSGLALMSVGDEGEGGGAGGAPAGGEGGAGAAPEGGEGAGAAAGEGEGGASTETGASTEGAGAGEETLGGGAAADDLGGEEGDEPAAPKRVPWYQKRIDQTTARARALEEENLRLRALVGGEGGAAAEGAGGEGTESAPAGAAPPAGRPGADVVYRTPDGKPLYTEEQLAARASSAAQINTLNEKCEKLYQDGKTAFKDFDKRLAPMNQAFGQELARRLDFFEVLTDLDNAPAVFHELAGDLDRLEEVLALPPHRLGVELAKMSAKAGKPVGKVISKAPEPITPITGGAGEGEPDLAKVDMKTYEEIRDRQRAERYASRGGR